VCHDKEIAISSHSSENLEYAVYVLEHIGSSFIHEGQTLKIGSLPLSKGEQIALSSPSSWWCMALALISLKRSNILLKNPGEITTLWPNFWAIWRGFPRPQDRIQSQGLRQSPSEQDKSTKGHRRIIVR
jgi:3-phosphoshikimate 1-carboxyvinyltransferase